MILLAIDTTTRWGSVALLRDDDVVAESRLYEEGGHSRWLFPAIESVLRFAGTVPTSIDGYAVAMGPGSFTGVRVGIGAVQGLALASGRPCLGISTLEALAARMRGMAPVLVPMVDAYRDQVYVAVYDGTLRERQGPAAFTPETALETVPAGAAFLGDGARRYRDTILARRPDAVLPPCSLFLAAAVGRLAAPRLAAGEGGEAAALRPLYLRGPDIRPAPALPER